jgi:activator of 2-hydroxyglutaryl-CoA dehydratase
MVKSLEDKLRTMFLLSPEPQIMRAYGAALIAME